MSTPLHLFISNPWNFNVMTEDELDSLSADIKSGAVIEKIIVRKKGERYEIIDGEQRIKAFKLLGKAEIPNELLDIRDYNDAQVRSYVRSSLTRGSRKDLVKEAELYLEDWKASGLDMKAYAEKIGIDNTMLSKLLKRNNMGLPAKAFVQRNNIYPKVLDEVLMVRPDYIMGYLQRAIEERWTVEDAKLAVKMGVAMDGSPVKDTNRKADIASDVIKLDLVDRATLSQSLSGMLMHLSKSSELCKMRGVGFTAKEFDILIAKVGKVKNRVDGSRVVYSQRQGEAVRKLNDVSEWLASGSDEERMGKVEKVNTRIKEVYG